MTPKETYLRNYAFLTWWDASGEKGAPLLTDKQCRLLYAECEHTICIMAMALDATDVCDCWHYVPFGAPELCSPGRGGFNCAGQYRMPPRPANCAMRPA